MLGVWESLNLGSTPNFFLCFGMHPKIIDVYPKLIPKGGVVQFCHKFVHELPFNPTCRRNIDIDVWYWLQIQHLNIKHTNHRTWEKNIQNASVNDTREEYNNIVLEVQGLPCLRQPSEPGNTKIRFRKDSFRPLISPIFHERLFKRNDHHHHQSHHHHHQACECLKKKCIYWPASIYAVSKANSSHWLLVLVILLLATYSYFCQLYWWCYIISWYSY